MLIDMDSLNRKLEKMNVSTMNQTELSIYSYLKFISIQSVNVNNGYIYDTLCVVNNIKNIHPDFIIVDSLNKNINVTQYDMREYISYVYIDDTYKYIHQNSYDDKVLESIICVIDYVYNHLIKNENSQKVLYLLNLLKTCPSECTFTKNCIATNILSLMSKYFPETIKKDFDGNDPQFHDCEKIVYVICKHFELCFPSLMYYKLIIDTDQEVYIKLYIHRISENPNDNIQKDFLGIHKVSHKIYIDKYNIYKSILDNVNGVFFSENDKIVCVYKQNDALQSFVLRNDVNLVKLKMVSDTFYIYIAPKCYIILKNNT